MSDSQQSSDHTRRRRWISDDETVSEAVVEAVATADAVGPNSLPPLGNRLDTDALDDLFASRESTTSSGLIFARTADMETEFEVRFRYAKHDVTVTDNYVVLE